MLRINKEKSKFYFRLFIILFIILSFFVILNQQFFANCNRLLLNHFIDVNISIDLFNIKV